MSQNRAALHIALGQLGADTNSLEALKDTQLSKAAEDALNTEAPHRGFLASELKPGWKTAVYPHAMRTWLEGNLGRREDIVAALDSFLPTTIVCGYCVNARTHAHISGPHCIRPGQLPPCPIIADPFSELPALLR